MNDGSLLYGRLGYIDTQFKVQDWSAAQFELYSLDSGFNASLGVEAPIYGKSQED